MLASITPLGERGRNQRWRVTMAAFVAGSIVGGAAVGGLLGRLGGAVLGSAPAASRLLALGLLLVAGLGLDVRRGGLGLPSTRRQVNEDWLSRYRGWVYGLAFGFQLGVGVVTVVTTSGVYLTLVAALLTGSASAGALVGGAFGLIRALPVLLTGRVRRPGELVELHRRLRAWDRPALGLALGAQAALAAVAIGLWAAA
jgi:sulfite exporter TauE/SafE